MGDTLRHRGPDDAGAVALPGGRVALGHRRLSIIDLSPAGPPADGQRGRHASGSPTTARSTTTRALRAELEATGHRYRSHTDTEAIVHLYEEEGAALRRAARGHVRVRDLGRAPPASCSSRATASASSRCTTRGSPGGFVFGSEIKALLEHPAVPRDLDEEAFADYLTFGFTPAAADDVPRHRASSARASGCSSPPTATSRPRRGGTRCRRRTVAERAAAMSEDEMVAEVRAAAARVDRQADDVRRPVRRLPLRAASTRRRTSR